MYLFNKVNCSLRQVEFSGWNEINVFNREVSHRNAAEGKRLMRVNNYTLDPEDQNLEFRIRKSITNKIQTRLE